MWRFTPKADTVGDIILPTEIHGDLEIGLRGASLATYSAAASYRVPTGAPMTIYGQLIGDYANTGYVYGSLDLNGEAGLSAQLNIIGQFINDTSTLYGKSSLGNLLTIMTQDMSFLNYGSVDVYGFYVNNHLNTIFDNTTLRWLGTTNQCAIAHIDGKGSGTTQVSLQGNSTTWRITDHLYIGHTVAPAVGLTLADYSNGLCINPTNLTLGTASIVDFSTANSYWLFNTASPTITDLNVNPTTVGDKTVYGTPNLGLIVADSVLLYLDCSIGKGLQADLLYLHNATFKTIGTSNRTLYLRANSGVATNYAAAVTDTDSVGLTSQFVQPALHAYGTSNFQWPSLDTNHCDYGGSSEEEDLLVLGSPTLSSPYHGNAIFTKQSKCDIGNTTGLSRHGRHTVVYNYGGGFNLTKNNGDGVSVTHTINQTQFIGANSDSSLVLMTNYNGSSSANRDILNITYCKMTQPTVSAYYQLMGSSNCLNFYDLTLDGNVWDGKYSSTILQINSAVYESLVVRANTVTNTHTSGTCIYAPNQPGWSPSNNLTGIIFENNYFNAPNLTSGTVFKTPVAIDYYSWIATSGYIIGRNTIHTSSAGTPIDATAAVNLHLVGWSLPTSNQNFGYSLKDSNTNYAVSEFTNRTNLATTIISGQLTNFKSTVSYAPDMWVDESATGPNGALTMVHGDSTYRYGAGNSNGIQEVDFHAPPVNPIKIEWENWDDDDAITLNIYKRTGTGANSAHWISVTNGQVRDLNVSLEGELAPTCTGWLLKVGFPTDTAAYKNLKITDSVTGAVLFADYQLLKLNTQEEAASTQGQLEFSPAIAPSTGPAGWSGNRGHVDNTQGALSHLYNTPKLQELSMELNLAAADFTPDSGMGRWAISFGGQDIDNQYVYRLKFHMVGGTQKWDYSIVKIVAGTETTLTSGAQASSIVAQDIALMTATWNPATGAITGNLLGMNGWSPSFIQLSTTDTSFNDGYYGFGADSVNGEPIIKRTFVREGDGTNDIVLRNTSVVFMPGSKFIPTTSISNIVDMRDVVFNGNIQAVFPGLNDGKFTPVLVNVSWADNRIDEIINTFIQLVGARIEVDGDIQIVDEGKLWLTGCYITGKNNKRWRIRTEQVSDPTTPPLKIEGCLLSGLLTTIRIPGASDPTYVLDDPDKNVAVIRVQSDKDIEVVRQRVTGLDYDRMVFNGFESRQTTITCQCVQNAYIMGMMEKLWRENTLVELISPYCYTFRGKITSYNQRILNPQISASQFVIEVEEWRED